MVDRMDLQCSALSFFASDDMIVIFICVCVCEFMIDDSDKMIIRVYLLAPPNLCELVRTAY